MSAIVSEPNAMEKCSSKVVNVKEPQECAKNGLVNGMVHINEHKMNKNKKTEALENHAELMPDIKEFQGAEIINQNHTNLAGADVNNIGKSKKKTKRKKHKTQLDSNENLNESKLEENSHQSSNDCVESESYTNKLDSAVNSTETEVAKVPSCSKTSHSNSEISCDTIPSNLEKLVIKDDSKINAASHSENDEACHRQIDFVRYESELQMPMIMKIIQKDLSEPYSIYTYRYFIHNWPKLCFLAMCEGQCVGAIVCKLDLHRKVVRRGYIAMLAVDQNFRKLRIGSTLVQMAIHEMTKGDADEVVLETEVTNKPALKLYEKLGFVRDKRLFRYYLNGVDALRLKLWLR